MKANWIAVAALACGAAARAQPMDSLAQAEAKQRAQAKEQTQQVMRDLNRKMQENLTSYFSALGVPEDGLAEDVVAAWLAGSINEDHVELRDAFEALLRAAPLAEHEPRRANYKKAMRELAERGAQAWSALEAKHGLAGKLRLRAAVVFVSPQRPFTPFLNWLLFDRSEMTLPSPDLADLPDTLAGYKRAVDTNPEFYEVRRRASVRDWIRERFKAAGYSDRTLVLDAALRTQREIESAREEREDAALPLWNALLDKATPQETLGGLLSDYDKAVSSGASRVTLSVRELYQVGDVANNARLEALLDLLGMADTPGFQQATINDARTHSFWFHQRLKQKQK